MRFSFKTFSSKIKSETGAATLLTAVVLLLATTLTIIFAAKVVVNEQRISANDYRAKEAFADAERHVDLGAAFFRATSGSVTGWTQCNGTTALPCGDGVVDVYGPSGQLGYATTLWYAASVFQGTSDVSYFLTKTPGADLVPITVVGEGQSADGAGRAVVQKTISKFSLLSSGPLPPILAPLAAIGGNMTVVANPDSQADGTNVPISVWSVNPFQFGGCSSMATCQLSDFTEGGALSGTRCVGPSDYQPNVDQVRDAFGQVPSNWNTCSCVPANVITECNDPGYDSLVNDPDAPGNPQEIFEYVFGRPYSQWWTIKSSLPMNSYSNMGVRAPNCDEHFDGSDLGLGPSTTGIIWIQGDCDLKDVSDDQLGSRFAPVVLVVEGDLTINASDHVWGIVYVTNRHGTGSVDATGSESEVKVNGSATLHGALVSEWDLDGLGGFTVIYDPEMFDALKNSDFNVNYGNVLGSWNDRLFVD